MKKINPNTIQEIVVDYINQPSEAGFSVIYKRLKPMVYSIVSNSLKDSDVVKDIVQNVFVKIYTNISQYSSENGGMFSSWCCKITRNEIVSFSREKYVKKSKKNTSIDKLKSAHGYGLPELEGTSLHIKEKEDCLWEGYYDDETTEMNFYLKKLMDKYLDRKDMEIFLDYIINEKKMTEAAEKWNISVSKIKNKVFACRKKIRTELQKRNIEKSWL